jgi:hypothetical protein
VYVLYPAPEIDQDRLINRVFMVVIAAVILAVAMITFAADLIVALLATVAGRDRSVVHANLGLRLSRSVMARLAVFPTLAVANC